MSTTVALKLSRPNRIYRPSDPLEGKIVVKSASSISHYGIRMAFKGSVNLQVRRGSARVIESFYGVVKPIIILSKILEIKPSGKIVSGTTEIPFTIILRNPKEDNLERFYETFHGTNISIQYLATVDIMRGYLHKSLSATVEFIVESDKGDLFDQPISPEMVIFYITQDTQRHPILPELKSGGFHITGRISSQCSMLEPLSGELTVEASALPICSIDIHLLRVESILFGEKIITETSLIQTTQIADGDVCRNLTMPIYVVLPRLLTCPTVLAGIQSCKLASWSFSHSSCFSSCMQSSCQRLPRTPACTPTSPPAPFFGFSPSTKPPTCSSIPAVHIHRPAHVPSRMHQSASASPCKVSSPSYSAYNEGQTAPITSS